MVKSYLAEEDAAVLEDVAGQSEALPPLPAPEDTEQCATPPRAQALSAKPTADEAERARLREEKIKKKQARLAKELEYGGVDEEGNPVGAVIAPSRAGAGFEIPVGSWGTCLVDAVFCCIKLLDPDAAVSKNRLRKQAMPALGGFEAGTTVKSVREALVMCDYKYEILDVTALKAFKTPWLNLLKQKGRVFAVTIRLRLTRVGDVGGGKLSSHAIALSTIPVYHPGNAFAGMVVDNFLNSKPVYIHYGDLRSPAKALDVFKKFLMQNPAARGCCMQFYIMSIYEVTRAGAF